MLPADRTTPTTARPVILAGLRHDAASTESCCTTSEVDLQGSSHRPLSGERHHNPNVSKTPQR
jgi:hypothetical protein